MSAFLKPLQFLDKENFKETSIYWMLQKEEYIYQANINPSWQSKAWKLITLTVSLD